MPSQTIQVSSTEGNIPTYLAHPEGHGPWPGVLFFMDGPGWRPQLFAMADRLAGYGYCVVMPNLHWRAGDYPPFDLNDVFAGGPEMDRMRKTLSSTTEEGAMRDTRVLVDWMSGQRVVRDGQRVGVHGYCMGGGFAMLAACVLPNRFAAALSFHGGRFVVAPEAPERLAREAEAPLYIGVAEKDRQHTPEVTAKLRAALAGKHCTIETYPGTSHGFCVPGTPVYDEAASERHWERLLALYTETLRP